MSRLVHAMPKPDRRIKTTIASGAGSTRIKEYTERVAKYVPAEIVAAFTTLTGVFANSNEDMKKWAMIIITLLLWGFTFFYFKWMKTAADDAIAVKTQQWVSFIAFIVWAYVVSGEQGIFGKLWLNIYYPEIGSAIMILFSLVSGFIIPRKTTEPAPPTS